MFAKIQADRLAAMGKDKVKFNILGVVIADIQRAKTKDITDADVIKVLTKMKKDLSESIQNTKTVVSASEKVAQFQLEQEIIESYLPKQLSDDELFSIMNNAVLENGTMLERKNMFPFLKKLYNGQYNGAQASQVFEKVVKFIEASK